MRIACVHTGDESYDIVDALNKLGFEAVLYDRSPQYSIVNMDEINLLAEFVRKNKITHLISTHLIYNLSVVAGLTGIKYVSIIWDAPYDKLYSPYGEIDNCWFSVFDKVDAQRFRDSGFAHILYQPLSVNPQAINKWKSLEKVRGNYYNDVCFIGSLYDNNAYDRDLPQMPEIMRGYFDSIFEEAAFRWDSINRVYGKTGNEVVRYLQMVIPGFDLDNTFDVEDHRLFEDLYLVRKLANIERISCLNMLAEYFQVTCCTYDRPCIKQLKGVRVMPTVAGGEPFALMALSSKINLNISLRGIMGGTPKRVMDIMSVGGFMLTNYCEETAELFEEGKEIEMFRTPEELVEKVGYYLAHDKERENIAKAGQEKILENYIYEKSLKQLFDWVEEKK